MKFVSISSLFVIAFLILSLSHAANAQTYYPGDWSGPIYEINGTPYVSIQGDGIAEVSTDGQTVHATTGHAVDHAYVGCRCDAIFQHNGVGPASIYMTGTGKVWGAMSNSGYGSSYSNIGSLSGSCTPGQTYMDTAVVSLGSFSIDSTHTTYTFQFYSTASSNGGSGSTYAEGDVDKNVD